MADDEAAQKAAQDAAEAAKQQAAADDKPPWGEDFKPEKAWSTIKQQRESEAAAKERAKELEAELQEFKDRDKTDVQKKDEELSKARDRATYADKLDVALDKAPDDMSAAQIRKLAKRLTGSTKEELETDAEELFADFTPSGDGGGGNGNSRRPTERLRPGAAPTSEPEEDDPRKLAEKVGERY